jgi:hypothetical protein
MQKMLLSILGAGALVLTGCASTGAAMPSGLAAGKFVTFACEGGKVFSARAAEDGRTVRVRAHHGSAELDQRGEGVYEGEGYRLTLGAPGAVSLTHGGKSQGEKCRSQ